MIYLDNNATTKILPEALEAMNEVYARPMNASSVHTFGRKARSLLENARLGIAETLSIELKKNEYKIIFTSSGTESNNLIINNFKNNKIIITAVEHLSIYEHARNKLIDISPVDINCMLQLNKLEELLYNNKDKQKILLSVIYANNETGAIQPIREIVDIAKKHNAYVHIDAVQAYGKFNLNFQEIGADFMTLSSHKIGGPVGIAALVCKDNFHLTPDIIGGGQEKGSRSGTENVIGAVGFETAARFACSRIDLYKKKTSELQNRLEEGLKLLSNKAIVFANNINRLTNTTLVAIKGKLAQEQLIAFDMAGIAISSGSACSSGKVGHSHVLEAMKIPDELANCAIRISTNMDNTISDIDFFLENYAKIHKL